MKTLFFLVLTGLLINVKAQIVLDNVYAKAPALTKLQSAGYKYTIVDIPAQQIKIYNTNHSLYTTINIPVTPLPINTVAYISDQLFDNDNSIEYALVTMTVGPPPTLAKFYIYKENGTQVMFRDSASFLYSGTSIFSNSEPVYFDGANTKMRLAVAFGFPSVRHEVYTLPGSIPCSACTGGSVTGMAKNPATNSNDPMFFPNPASTQLKLKYNLPKDYKTAAIKVHDTQGKLMEEFKVTNDFEYIYIPTDYNNGMYFYSLIIDGVIIKTEKIILNK